MKTVSPILSIPVFLKLRQILFVLPLLCFSYSNLVSQTYTFSKATMCKDVQNNYPYAPINETTSFSVGEIPHAWIEITNIYGTSQIRFDWHRPDRSLYNRTTTSNFSSNGGWVRYYSSKNLGNTTGRWYVKFYIKKNGVFRLLTTKYFNYEATCICPAIYDPVCGSDGLTYGNSCEAECAGVTWTSGDCNSCICPAVYDPVCGSDGLTYGNSCEAECAGVTWTSGDCNSCICPAIYDPVCGSDGLTYGNSCEAECAGVTWTSGECNTCICPAVYDPVCGSDGLTYGNSCEAECAGVTWTSGECNTCICPAVYDPVCGSDGVTYSNSCKAECAGVSWTPGACGANNSCACTNSYSDYICDDFQSYSTNRRLGPQSSCWTTWSGNEGGLEDAIVQRNNTTRNQFIQIKGTSSSGGTQDVVLKLGDKTRGKYNLKFRIWLFNGDKGYYNIQHRFREGGGSSNEWASNVYFDGNGSGRLVVRNATYRFAYTTGKWIDVEQVIDLNGDDTYLYIDGKYVHRWRFSYQATTSSIGTNRLSAINFYPTSRDNEFYIDNVSLNKLSNVSDNTESRSRISSSLSTEASVSTLVVAPNPFMSTINVKLPEVVITDLSVIDQLGRTVYTYPESIDKERYDINIDLQNLPKGVYYLRLLTPEKLLTKKIIKHSID